jgi:hypothetical protein
MNSPLTPLYYHVPFKVYHLKTMVVRAELTLLLRVVAPTFSRQNQTYPFYTQTQISVFQQWEKRQV